jgi:hypothetical protein
VAKTLERGRAHARDLGLGIGLGEGRERADVGFGEALHLEARDAGDERQVVVLFPARLAELEEVAEAAVLDRVGICGRLVLDRTDEALPEATVVGAVVLGTEGLALAEAGDDVHEFGVAPLNARELLTVEAELEHVLGPRVAGELRVDDLVGAVGEELEEVGDPAPAVVLELGLVDDVGFDLADGLYGFGGGLRLGDGLALGTKLLEVAPLMLLALATDQVRVEVDAVWLLELPARDVQLKRRQVRTGEERAEIGGGKG